MSERKTFVFGTDAGFEEVDSSTIQAPEPQETVTTTEPQETKESTTEPQNVSTEPTEPTTEPTEPTEPNSEGDDGEGDEPTESQGDEGGEDGEPTQTTESQGDEGQEDEGEGDTIVETDSFYEYALARMKQAGEIPEDFELPEDVDEDTASEVIFNKYVESLQEDVNAQLLEEFRTNVAQRGWNEQTLTYASMLQNGVAPEEITRIVDYDKEATRDISELDGDDARNYITKMYRDQGYKEKDIQRILDTAEVEGEIDSLKTEAQQHFSQRKVESEEEQKRIALQNQQMWQQEQARQLQVINDIFDTGEFAGEKFTDDMLNTFESAIFDASIPYQGEDGIVRNATPFQQFQNALSQNFELQLWAFKKYMFNQQEQEMVKEQATKQAEQKARVKWSKGAKAKGGKAKSKNSQPPSSEAIAGGDYVYDPATNQFTEVKK